MASEADLKELAGKLEAVDGLQSENSVLRDSIAAHKELSDRLIEKVNIERLC